MILKHILASTALIATLVGQAQASTLELQIAGVFDAQADDPNNLDNLAPFEGQAFTYTFTYDPSVLDRNTAETSVGVYLFTTNGNQGGRLDLEPFAVTEREHEEMLVNDPPGTGGDNDPTISLTASSLDPDGLALPADPTAFVFNVSGKLLPPDLSDFDFGNTGTNPLPGLPGFLLNAPPSELIPTLTLAVPGGTETLGGSITGITVVPAPKSIAALGVSGLLVIRRRRH